MTPRKTQRRGNEHAQSIAAPVLTSDYESEAFYPTVPLMHTHDAINLTVLQRYVPSLLQILCRAPKAELYTYSIETERWELANIEGTLFVGTMTPSPLTGSQRHCIVVINRKGMQNLVIESGEIETVEITDEFLLLGFRDHRNHGSEVKILGFFIFADPQLHSREYICQLIKEHWEIAQMDRYRSGQQEAVSYDDEVLESIEEGAHKPLGEEVELERALWNAIDRGAP